MLIQRYSIAVTVQPGRLFLCAAISIEPISKVFYYRYDQISCTVIPGEARKLTLKQILLFISAD